MNITAVLTTLCNIKRIEWMLRSVLALEGCKFKFSRKLLFVAESGGETLPDNAIEALKSNGWEIFTDQYRNRPKTFTDILSAVDTEWIFYNEEDIIIEDMPSNLLLDRLELTPIDGRMLGQLSMTAGGSTFNCGGGDMGDFHNIEATVLDTNDDKVVILRDEAKRSNFFVNFPCLFIRKDILQQCHNYAIDHCHSISIEEALSKAYFDLGLDKSFYKASVLRSNFLDLVRNSPETVDGKSLLFKCLDPHQGLSVLGGCHAY
jgi:hypothetical protein